MAILNVNGITNDNTDYLRLFSNILEKQLPDDINQVFTPKAIEEILSLLVNLSDISKGDYYKVRTLRIKNIKKEIYFEPSLEQMVNNAMERIGSYESGKNLAEFIKAAYTDKLLRACLNNTEEIKPNEYDEYIVFIKILLQVYTINRKFFLRSQKYYKMPNFEVLEIINEEDYGLVGFNIHFSNGSKAIFKRNRSELTCINLVPGVPVAFNVGLIDALEKNWKVGAKYLYEIGIPGKYNQNGLWKPIVFKGDTRIIEKRIFKITNDEDIAGVLFYIMCTCHWVIEFAMRINIDFPQKNLQIGNSLHFWKCDNYKGQKGESSNFLIYDGWYFLDDISPERIREGINTIAFAINLLSLVYNADVKWTIKYKFKNDSVKSYATPTNEDIKLLDKTIRKVPEIKDLDYLIPAIDCYIRGNSSKDVFNSYMCYFIVIDTISDLIYNNKANFDLEYPAKNKEERKKYTLECIKNKIDNLLKDDPIKFVEESYSECILSIKHRIEILLKIVFGSSHEFLNDMFKKKEKISLYDIRNKIAHGTFSSANQQEVNIVKARLPKIKNIAYELLIRIIYQIKSDENIPIWSEKHASSIGMSDPRNIMVTSKLDIFPNKDWNIKLEWIE